MLNDLLKLLPDENSRNIALTASGMAALLMGSNTLGLTLFGKGIIGLEEDWRRLHPQFKGGFTERLKHAAEYYEETHKNSTNRILHVIGIPMIIGGTAGLILLPSIHPIWPLSAGAFALGWTLNLIGHYFFEHNRPAFFQDPFSFVAGPLWELKRIFSKEGTSIKERALINEAATR